VCTIIGIMAIGATVVAGLIWHERNALEKLSARTTISTGVVEDSTRSSLAAVGEPLVIDVDTPNVGRPGTAMDPQNRWQWRRGRRSTATCGI
jgi:hypothetical protein